MAICTGVSNLHFQKLLLEVFEQKKLKKKLLIAAKEIIKLSLLLYNKFLFYLLPKCLWYRAILLLQIIEKLKKKYSAAN